jgi:hypothetical protein
MVAWEGDFGWQGYALQGRPDVLNYLHRGDVSWEGLWSFYRAREASAEAMMAVMNLFHAFMSAEYDSQGCWLDPDGEPYRHLRAWASFALEQEEILSESVIQAGLAHLADISLISAHYYHAAFQVYMESVLDQHAARWRREPTRKAAASRVDFPTPDARRLPIYFPEASRFAELRSDPQWEDSVRALLANHYQSWNTAYAAALVDEEVEETLRETGGTG